MASQERCQLPLELESDQQAAVLYSPFREKSLNPQSWSRKMKFWQNLLLETALERRTVTADVATLSLMFERKGIRPKCLSTVIEEMKKTGQIQSLDQHSRTHSWLSWGFNTLIKQPLTWGVSQVFSAANKDTAVYVWPAVVKKLCEDVIELYQASTQDELMDSLVSLTYLRSLCQIRIPSDSDFHIVFSQLERDHKISALETQDKEIVVKFCKSGELSASPVREIDVQIYRIRLTETRLEKDIEALSLTADRLLNDARTNLREGRKTMAKHCLRKQKVIVARMEHRYACLSKLQHILQTIQEASTNDMVVKACAAGAAVMTHLHKELSVEGIEAVMDEVREAIEVEEEIKQALSSSCLDGDDNEELELELQELLSTNVGEDKTGEKSKRTALVEDTSLQHVLAAAVKAETQGEKQLIDSNTQHLLHPLNFLTLDDLGLPDVPSHPPSSARHQETNKAGSSRQQLPS